MLSLRVKKRREDRISLLPDSLLYHILSFLSTIYVVRTCVLSKRWKTLWTCIPTLNFHYEPYFLLFFDGDMYSETIFRMFKNFVIRVLVKHCGTNIQKLSYISSEDDDEYVLLEFLTCYAGSHNVQQLCINACYIRFFDWTYCLSTCSSLTELKMVIRFVDNWGVLALPNLKFLEIQCDWDKRATNKEYRGITMFSGCPNLESLVLVDFLFQSATISTPKLENLELYVSHDLELTFPKVELLTPILKTVNFIHVLPIILNSDSEFSCIHVVNIQFKNSYFESDDDDDPFILKLRSTFRELLGVFHNASSFTLPLNATQLVQSSNLNALGLCFHNLRRLRLRTNETGYLLGDLLEAPNLKTFSVLHKDYEDRCIWPD